MSKNLGSFDQLFILFRYSQGCLFQNSFQWWWFLEQNQWYHVKCHGLVDNIAKCRHPGPDHKIDDFLKIVKKCPFFCVEILGDFQSVGFICPLYTFKSFIAISKSVQCPSVKFNLKRNTYVVKRFSIRTVTVSFQKIIF